jgi:hypothetical protein
MVTVLAVPDFHQHRARQQIATVFTIHVDLRSTVGTTILPELPSLGGTTYVSHTA